MMGTISTVEMDEHGGGNTSAGDDEHGGEQVSMVGMRKVVKMMSILGTDEYSGDG